MSQEIDYHDLVHSTARDLKELTQKVEAAFIKDEDGEPDYSGHRIYHRKVNNSEAQFQLSKSKVIKDVTSWAIIGILTVIGSGLFHTYILPLLPSLK